MSLHDISKKFNKTQAYKTTTALPGSSQYTSPIINLKDYSQVQTIIYSDQDGTITFRFYSNAAGTNVIRTLNIPYSASDGYQLFSAPVFGDYHSSTYTNGPTDQTEFHFQLYLLRTSVSPQLLAVNAFISPNMVSSLNRSIISAQQVNGTYSNVQSDNTGSLYNSQYSNEWQNLAIREIADTYGDTVLIKPKSLLKFGRSENIDSLAFHTVWTSPDFNETYLSTNTINRVVSTNAGDTQEIVIEGHTISGSDLTFVVQTATLNGRNNVTLTTPLVRVSRLYNNGTTDFLGTISCFDTTGTSTLGVVSPTSAVHITATGFRNQSEKATTTYSSVDYGIITQVYGGVLTKASAKVQFDLQVREFGKIFRTKYQWGASDSSGSVVIDLNPYVIVRPNSDIRIIATSSSNNTEVVAGFNSNFGLIQ